MYVVAGIVTLSWLLIIFRLGEIQIVHGSEYKDLAEKQSTGKIRINAQRGLIFDRHGSELAVNVISNSLYAYPTNKNEINRIHRYLDKLYSYSEGKSRKRNPLQPNRFRWLDRSLSDERAERIAGDSIPGLYLKEETKRDCPFGQVGLQLIGCTDIDGRGISGMEYYYDSILAGVPGLIDYLRDAKRNTFRIKEIPLIEPVSGNSIVLTVDWKFQAIVEEELKNAVEKYNAKEGTAVFLDCNTGEILAAADYITGEKNSSVKLRAASDCFEPGSVFKVFTAAALLDEELVDFEEKIYCENGLWKCERGRLRDDKKHDSLIFQEIFELSSNIGIGKLALRLGGEKLVETCKRFGFGNKTFSGLPGEQAGMIGKPGVWSEYNIAALAMGHSISVTALQLATAVASVANGGQLLRPSIVKGIINPEGNIIEKNTTEIIGRIIKKESAAVLREFMKGVVERGTATPVLSDIVSIAGKTGTAEVVDSENGGYIKNRFNASFLGFFPADNPQIAGVVVLHQPKPITYGGYTSGPAFKNMAERYSVLHPELQEGAVAELSDNEFELKKIPDFTGQDFIFAVRYAAEKGMALTANDTSGIIVWQYPPEGRKIPGGETIAVIVQNENKSDSMVSLKGMKIRTALAVLNHQGLIAEIEGTGKVMKQYPSPGTPVEPGKKCRLVCGSS